VMERDFFGQPNYLRFQGKPAVFWFNPPSLGGVGTWQQLRERADPGREQYWFGGTDNFGFLDVYDALYYFDITWESAPGVAMRSYGRRLDEYNARTGQSRPFVATVMPGYDDLRYRGGHARDRQGGDYYRGTWQTAIDRNAQAVVLTSFNEYFEGTHIEPSERYGDLYLRLTKELSDSFRAQAGRAAPPTARARATVTTGLGAAGAGCPSTTPIATTMARPSTVARTAVQRCPPGVGVRGCDIGGYWGLDTGAWAAQQSYHSAGAGHLTICRPCAD
jgi:hypothetical protein